jgi:hypothetical protein
MGRYESTVLFSFGGFGGGWCVFEWRGGACGECVGGECGEGGGGSGV